MDWRRKDTVLPEAVGQCSSAIPGGAPALPCPALLPPQPAPGTGDRPHHCHSRTFPCTNSSVVRPEGFNLNVRGFYFLIYFLHLEFICLFA